MLKSEIFDLTTEQLDLTKMFYDGKVIKCLVAPYHTAKYFEENLKYAENVFVFPENSIPRDKLGTIIGMIVANPKYKEAVIITTSNEIITQMIGENVRVFTETGNIVDCPIKCLMANIHDIRYSLLENDSFKDAKGTNVSNFGTGFTQALLDKLKNTKIADKKEYELFKSKIELIGEPLIREKMLEMLNEKI
jgi:hypothetical protein